MNPVELKSAEQFHQTLENQSMDNSRVSVKDTLEFIKDNIQYLNQTDAKALQNLRARANKIDLLEDKLTIIERIDELAQAITNHATLKNIPKEVAIQIIALLDKEDLNNLRQVDKHLNQLVYDPSIIVIFLKKYMNELSAELAINLACRCGAQLKELDLRVIKKEDITDKHLKQLAKNCPQLKILRLPYSFYANEPSTRITDEGFIAITQLSKLQILEINIDRVSPESLKTITNLKELQSLEIIHANLFNDDTMESIAQLKNLKSLIIDNITSDYDNRNIHISDKGLSSIANSLANLEHLYLPKSANFSDDGLLVLANNCSHLKTLSLNFGNFTEEGFTAIANGMKDLQILSLRNLNERVTDITLQLLSKLNHLQSLILGNCKVTDEGFKYIAKHFPHLKSLSLMYNWTVTSQGLKIFLDTHKELQKLQLYAVDFTFPDIKDETDKNPNLEQISSKINILRGM